MPLPTVVSLSGPLSDPLSGPLSGPPPIESVIDLLVRTVLAGEMEPATRDRLRVAAGGDRSVLEGVVLAGLGSGELARVNGRWTFTRRCTEAADINLTRREQQIVLLLSEGLTAQSIGRRLGLSPRTVAKYLQRVYRKFGTSDRLTTVLRAQRLGLLPPAA